MHKRTCTHPNCKAKHQARGLCSKHYYREWREGFQPRLELRPVHRLSNIDKESRTGICAVCGPVDVRLGSERRGAECMERRRQDRRKYRKANPRWKYGITQADYDQMVIDQDGKCAICGTTPEKLFVDHCHDTGNVRQLLCLLCNSGIGFLRDNTTILKSAVDYLTRHECVEHE